MFLLDLVLLRLNHYSLPQKGNPKPRVFRLEKDKAIINRLGFNNKGSIKVKKNLIKIKKVLQK